MDEMKIPENTTGVKISDDVVQIIAGIAAGEVKGVHSMGNTLTGGIAELLGGKKPVSRGVKVDIQENSVTIDMHIVVQYGFRIPDIAWQVQEKVKEAVENMTGLTVLKVNIHIDGINIEKDSQDTSRTAQDSAEEA